MTNEIIVDTNVVIAAGIIQNIGKPNIAVKHKFYDQSIRLLSLFKRDNDCCGVLVSTVKNESFTVPARAAYETFLSDSSADPQLRALFCNDAAGVVTSSGRKMRKWTRRPKGGEYDPGGLCKNIERVKPVSRDLRTEREEGHAGKNRRGPESGRDAETVLNGPETGTEKGGVSAHGARIAGESLRPGCFVRKSNPGDGFDSGGSFLNSGVFRSAVRGIGMRVCRHAANNIR